MPLDASDSVTDIVGVGSRSRGVSGTVEKFVFSGSTIEAINKHTDEAAQQIARADFSATNHTQSDIALNKIHTVTNGAMYDKNGDLQEKGPFQSYRYKQRRKADHQKTMDFIWTRHAVYGDWTIDLPRQTDDFKTQPTHLIPAHHSRGGRHDPVYVVTTGRPDMYPNEYVRNGFAGEEDTVIPAEPLERFATVLDTSPRNLVRSMSYDQDSPLLVDPDSYDLTALIASSHVSGRENMALSWCQVEHPKNGTRARYVIPVQDIVES